MLAKAWKMLKIPFDRERSQAAPHSRSTRLKVKPDNMGAGQASFVAKMPAKRDIASGEKEGKSEKGGDHINVKKTYAHTQQMITEVESKFCRCV